MSDSVYVIHSYGTTVYDFSPVLRGQQSGPVFAFPLWREHRHVGGAREGAPWPKVYKPP